MRHSVIVLLLGLTSVISAKPAFLPVPLTYATPVTSGTQVITNSGLLDGRPEMAVAGIRHAAARDDERTKLTATRFLQRRQSSLRIADDEPMVSTSFAPLDVDGRVVDTAEVAAAKAAHAAAHTNQRIQLAREAARSAASDSPKIADNAVVKTTPEAAIGSNGRILDTPEVATVNELGRIRDASGVHLAHDAVVPLVVANGVVAVLVPEGSLDDPDVGVRGNGNLLNNVKSVDALAVAGPALAYGRLVY